MNEPLWIWQQPNWPHFSWQADALAPLLRACSKAQGRLLGMLGGVGSDTEVQNSLDALLQNIVTSSAIEGEQLNVGSVRSSLARRLGLNEEGRTTPRSEGLAELMLDATRANQQPLDLQRLFKWHGWLFPSNDHLLSRPIGIGMLRGEEPRWYPADTTAPPFISRRPRAPGWKRNWATFSAGSRTAAATQALTRFYAPALRTSGS